MNSKQHQRFVFLIILMSGLFTTCCAQNSKQNKTISTPTTTEQDTARTKVTFIELGSVRCIPCKEMQPIMKSIEAKFGTQVKVVFYDVWTASGKTYADKFKVQLIPTQVFLDEKGQEFFRHEGFFPEEELVKVLRTKGVR